MQFRRLFACRACSVLLLFVALFGALPVLASTPLTPGGNYYWYGAYNGTTKICVSTSPNSVAACSIALMPKPNNGVLCTPNGGGGGAYNCFDGGTDNGSGGVTCSASAGCLFYITIGQYTNYPGPTCTPGFVDQNINCTAQLPPQEKPGTTRRQDAELCPNDPRPLAQTQPKAPGMCVANVHLMLLSLNLDDTPVGYQPAVGPGAFIRLSYNHKEAGQPATFNYFNVGQKWTLNILSFVQDDPANPGQSVTRAVGGGGFTSYPEGTGTFNTTTGAFPPELQSQAVLTRIPATGAVTSYTLTYPDGTKHVFAKLDGASTKPRRVFLSQIVDPAGNALSFNYDSTLRLTSITDAAARNTTFSYANTNPLLVTQITDPFGRYASLGYDTSGRLSSITDVVGITSSFTYDTTDPTFIKMLTTPYGARNFAYGSGVTSNTLNTRWLELTDPLGQTERLEYMPNAPGIAAAPTPVPSGISVSGNSFAVNNTFFWDAHAYPIAITKDGSGNITSEDYTKARITHWLNDTNGLTTSTVAAVKNPLERYVYMNYPGQPTTYQEGSANSPAATGRVLDDGTSQVDKKTYNSLGYPLTVTDPKGRITTFAYDTNNIDLLTVQQKTSASGYTTIATYSNYNTLHEAQTATDAAGQVWHATYNAAGQTLTVTDPLSHVTTFNYDAKGRRTSIVNANSITQVTYNYLTNCDVSNSNHLNCDLPVSMTDSEGRTVAYARDALDRVTKLTYPDATTEQFDWNFQSGTYTGTASLDLRKFTDRLGRVTTKVYDANRRLISVTEPVTATTTRTTQYAYWENGVLKSITDANLNVTSWDIDIQGRPTVKHYADSTTTTTAYETTTSRIKSLTDALSQVRTYAYGLDDQPTGITYTGAINPTPNVSFAYDTYFPRKTSMTDGNGTTNYTYKAIGTLGALQPAGEDGPFANDVLSYGYDELGRRNSLTTSGTAAETTTFDAIGRLSTHVTGLGSFTYGYLGQTGQTTSRIVTNGSTTVSTSWGYDTNTNDRRLKTITNNGVTRSYGLSYLIPPANTQNNPYDIQSITDTAAATHPWVTQSHAYGYDNADRLLTATASGTGNYTFGYDPLDNITNYVDPATSATPTYNNLNELKTWGTKTYTFDANGNTTGGDGLKTYKWDAENRLKEIDYVGGANKTVFTYDGLGRRTLVAETVSGTTTTTRFLWCGAAPCQQRTSGDVVTTRYFPEGELNVTSGQKLVYMPDQLGSVRDVVDATAGALVAALDYSPYGAKTRTWGSVTPGFQYAGLFYHPASGLMLSATRVYDPTTGKWSQRDFSGEEGGVNVSEYGGANPVNNIDPEGYAAATPIPGVPGLPFVMPPHYIPGTSDFDLWQKFTTHYGHNFGQNLQDFWNTICHSSNASQDTKDSNETQASDSPNLVDKKGEEHILSGDGNGGGHRPGAGVPGKSEFPADWSDERILDEISDVATDPSSTQIKQGNRTVSEGTRGGVGIRTVHDGSRIITGYPTNLPRNPPK